jgi:hypothetical protein
MMNFSRARLIIRLMCHRGLSYREARRSALCAEFMAKEAMKIPWTIVTRDGLQPSEHPLAQLARETSEVR